MGHDPLCVVGYKSTWLASVSNIFHHVISRNQSLTLNVGSGAPVAPLGSQGLLLDDTGAIYATTTTPPTKIQYALPFDDDGRLVVEDAAPSYYDQGLPFTPNSALSVTDDNTMLTFDQGVPFGPSGGIYANGLGPPTARFFAVANFTGSPREVFWSMSTEPWNLSSPILESYSEGTLAVAGGMGVCVTGSSGAESVKVWDTSVVPFSEMLPISGVSTGQVNIISFAPNMTLCAVSYTSTSGTYFIDFSDINSPQVGLSIMSSQLNGVDWNSDSSVFASASISGTPRIRFWDASTLTPTEITPQLNNQPTQTCNGVAFYPPNEDIVIGAFSSTLVFDRNTNSLLGTLHSQSSAGGIAFNKSGTRLCIAYIGGFWVYDTSDPDWNNWTQGAQVPIGSSTAVLVRFWLDDDLCVFTDNTGDTVEIYSCTDINLPAVVTSTYIDDQTTVASPQQPALIY